jgi:hypothetical protein
MLYLTDFKLFEEWTTPKVGGCILILSNPFRDGFMRCYIATIDEAEQTKDTWRIKINPTLYILKEQLGGMIKKETIDFKKQHLLPILNMKSYWIRLNDNKTPFWKSSSIEKMDRFIFEGQGVFKQLEEKGVVFRGGKL